VQRIKGENEMKTSELTGAALDWAVGIAEGWKRYDSPMKQPNGSIRWTLMFDAGETCMKSFRGSYEPSTNWAQGGPIIERERISTQTTENHWEADTTTPEGKFIQAEGPTPLIAAMRCYVASKLGDEVEIPEELT